MSIQLTSCRLKLCDRSERYLRRGLCEMHYRRMMRTGELEAQGRNQYTGRGKACSYHRAHVRLSEDRGPAKEYDCVDCGDQAQQWSYDHTDPNELQEWYERDRIWLSYSTDQSKYQPRCATCHAVFDRRNSE